MAVTSTATEDRSAVVAGTGEGRTIVVTAVGQRLVYIVMLFHCSVKQKIYYYIFHNLIYTLQPVLKTASPFQSCPSHFISSQLAKSKQATPFLCHTYMSVVICI